MTTDTDLQTAAALPGGSDQTAQDSARRRNARLIFDAVVSGYIRDISGRRRQLIQHATRREAVSTA